MTRDEIIKLAREAGFTEGDISLFPDLIVHFAAMVAAAEREACAQMCDEAAIRLFRGKSRVNQVDRLTAEVLRSKAGAIRARSQA